MKRTLALAVFAVSVGLNLGIGATLLRRPSMEPPEAFDRACQVCSTTCARIGELREQQRLENRRLAELLVADTPERAEIERSLERMNAIGSAIQRQVVEAVLEQRAALPAELEHDYLAYVESCLAPGP